MGHLAGLCNSVPIVAHNIANDVEVDYINIALWRQNISQLFGFNTGKDDLELREVANGSPASSIGMKVLVGYQITHINGTPITTKPELRVEVGQAGRQLSIRLVVCNFFFFFFPA